MRYITVSGIDRSGKTSLIKSYLERTNYMDYIVDRDPSNIFALNIIQERFNDRDYSYNEYQKFIKSHSEHIDLAILLVCDIDILVERFIRTNEPDLVGVYEMCEHQDIITGLFHDAGYKNILQIDTTKISTEEAVTLVINKMKGIRNAN